MGKERFELFMIAPKVDERLAASARESRTNFSQKRQMLYKTGNPHCG
jgi:hypothetical protein